jgi:phosphoglycolate phosphatase-like HAD superfamily hydrolase
MLMYVCLFDIDGTLLSSGGAGKAALEEGLAEEFGVRGTMEKLVLSGRTDNAIVSDLLQLSGIADSPKNRARLFAGYLRHLPVCLSRCTGRVLPGVQALLQLLQARGDVVVGLLTGNIRAGARLKLGHYGLCDYFAFGGFGDRHHHRDDVAREALAEVHRHVGTPFDPSRLWVIGDTPHDVTCARAIGAKSVAVVTGWHDRTELAGCNPDLLLDDLSDPEPLVSCWTCSDLRRESDS